MAAKVFIAANRQQFTNERMIYRLLLEHENVARYLDSEERVGTEGRTEFLLLLEFYPHVSTTIKALVFKYIIFKYVKRVLPHLVNFFLTVFSLYITQ